MCNHTYTLVHSLWETHPNGQDQPSLQLGGSTLQPQMDCLSS